MSHLSSEDSPVTWRAFLSRFALLGLTGFGGPPAHLASLRRTWVDSGNIDAREFESVIASASIAPGPTSTQVAMWVGWHQRGVRGSIVAALLFISPTVVLMTVFAAALKNHGDWSRWILECATGAAWMMPAVVLTSSWNLVPRNMRPLHRKLTSEKRWFIGWMLTAFVFEQFRWVNPVAIIVVAGFVMLIRGMPRKVDSSLLSGWFLSSKGATFAGLALKVGLLSFGGGFVIVPIMRADAVTSHHWMSEQVFVAAVALGQLTPGPVFSTLSAVGYFADGLRGAIIGAILAFVPSLVLVNLAANRLLRIRESRSVEQFLLGAFPTSLGLIAGTAPLFVSTIHGWIGTLAAVGGLIALATRRVPLPVVLFAGAALGLAVPHP